MFRIVLSGFALDVQQENCYCAGWAEVTQLRRLFTIFFALVLLVGIQGVVPAQKPALQQQAQKQEQTVYITKTGKKYHRAGCRYLSHSKIPISLKEAKANGYTPCSVCRPAQ